MTIRRIPYDLSLRINRKSIATGCVTYGLQIVQYSVCPNKPVVYRIAREISLSYDITGIIDPSCASVVSTKSPQIREDSPIKGKGMLCQISGDIRCADNLSPIVQPARCCKQASESAHIRHLTVLPQERVYGRN